MGLINEEPNIVNQNKGGSIKMDKKTVVIGIGNCGSQVADLAGKKYSEIFDTICINTSDADLSQVSVSNLKFKIGENDEVEGSGKNRMKMKQYLQADIAKILKDESLQECMSTKKYAFVVVSAAGGTGSGAGPVLVDFMQHMFPETNFILVGVLPQINASLMEQGNALEFLNELYEILGESTTYMVYDNESVADQPPTVGLTRVNEEIVEDIRVLTGVDNFSTPYESIDAADMESIITTPGRLLVTRITKGITEKKMEDGNIDDMIIKSIKQSKHAETDRNKRVIRWGIITFFTEAVNKLYTNDFEKLREFIGTPVERFNHNAINEGKEELNFIYMIAAGLSPINDRVTKIKERIEELKNALASDSTAKYINDSEGVSYNVMEERKKLDKKAKADEDFHGSDIFKKYMK